MNYLNIQSVIENAADYVDPYKALIAAGLALIAGIIVFISRRRKETN